MRRLQRVLVAIILLVALSIPSGCAVNPVTGRRELTVVSESYELDIGRKNYGPSRQMQGGDYKVDEALTAYVNGIGQKLAAVSDRRLPYEFVVINNSTPNAWALPGGKLAINRGLLLELKNEAELAAVLGHEIVHAAARHGAKNMERGMLLQGALLATGIAVSGNDYANQIVGVAQVAATLLNQKYGRDAEREADEYGMKYMSRAGYDPMAAVTLQETFVRLSKDKRQDWLTGLFASHPPSQERVEANRRYARLLPSKGVLGEETYRNALAGLRKTADAYAAHDKGREALGKGDLESAKSLARQAISTEPRESLFHALDGDISFKEKRFRKAHGQYSEALKRDSGFFYTHVQRGLTRLELGDKAGAQSDLKRSLDLLPTAVANNALGNIARSQGNRNAAMGYYRAAADSQSGPGRQALASLVQMDLPANPQNYLSVEGTLDPRGYLMVRIGNPTPVTVSNVQLRIRYRDPQGNMQETFRRVSAPIAAGKTASVPLGIGPFTDQESLSGLSITPVQASTN